MRPCPTWCPATKLEEANRISIATTYGSALPAAAIFVVLSLVTKGIHSTLDWLETPVLLRHGVQCAVLRLVGLGDRDAARDPAGSGTLAR